jgi:serine phosphatase RsbU (regulator of sigma subunit)
LLVVWIDRFIPAELLRHRTEALRARVVVGASMFATTASLTTQGIRLQHESQHWIPLSSWVLCTLLFILVPLVMRLFGKLWLASSLVPLAVLIGALGVAVKEGGVSSPNAMVMIVAPVVATLLGGWRSGIATASLVVLSTVALWFGHAAGLSAVPDMELATLTTMRATILGVLSFFVFFLTLLYELERDRAQLELSDHAQELARAKDAVTEAAETKFELLAAQRRELERDLELTAAVQKLLLPRSDSFDTEYVSVAGFSVTAAQAGGDWWFSETLSDGTVRVVLGDVTGHGAAPAMVAAVVAGAFRALQETGQMGARGLLQVLNSVSRDVSAGMYTMPFGLLELSPFGRASWFSAAAPPLLVLRRDGTVDSITVAGTALASPHFSVGERVFDLSVGERILLTSDGVAELRLSSGYDLGLRRLSKLLRNTSGITLRDARDELAERLDALRGQEALQDDVTFALIELRRAHKRLESA